MEAENYRSGDADAKGLQVQAKEALDFQGAQTLFEEGEYARAEALCAAHGGVDRFKNLAGRIRTEKEEYDKDNNQFISGNYSFIDSLNRLGYSVKKPFTELLTKAVREKGILGELETFKQATNWMAVIERLAAPASADFATKGPFKALGEWARGRAADKENARKQRIAGFDAELKVWEVIFDSKARGTGIDYREVMYSAGSRPFKFMQSIGEAKQVGDRVKVVDNPIGADNKVYVRGLVEQLQGDYGELLDQGRQLRFKKLQERIADQGRSRWGRCPPRY